MRAGSGFTAFCKQGEGRILQAALTPRWELLRSRFRDKIGFVQTSSLIGSNIHYTSSSDCILMLSWRNTLSWF